MVGIIVNTNAELDGLKQSTTAGDAAAAATAWLLSQKTSRAVHVESRAERVAAIQAYGAAETDRPDDAVLSCCLHFKSVALWTGDKNLALLAEASGIHAVQVVKLAELGIGEDAMEVDAELLEPWHEPGHERGHEQITDPGSLAQALADAGWTPRRRSSRASRISPSLDTDLLGLVSPALDFFQLERPGTARVAAETLTRHLGSIHSPGFERPVSRAAGAARTLALFLGPEPEPRSGERRIRSGEAGDAIRLLVDELVPLGVPLRTDNLDSLVAEVRKLP